MGGPFALHGHLSIVILGLVPGIYRVDWLTGGWNELAVTDEAISCFLIALRAVPRVRPFLLVWLPRLSG